MELNCFTRKIAKWTFILREYDFAITYVMTLALGLWPRQGAWKGASRKCNPGVTFTFLRMWESVKKWTHTFPSGFPLRKLKFQWIPKFLESDLRCQNSLDWRVAYTIIKLLRLKCLKWAHMIHLSTYNTSYGWKKDQKSKWQFDS
jgi:hypothetical protein